MNRIVKLIGLLFLPIAIVVFLATFLDGKSGKNRKHLFLQEYDEQNIYG